jgi:WD repeat-containing protein 35
MSNKITPYSGDTKEEFGDDDYGDGGDDHELGGGSDDDLALEETGDTGYTQNQNRLLYLISLYSHCARNAKEKEEWIRRQALMVLIYECVVEKVLDYDYAPESRMVEGKRKYFNMSQEGRSDVDFLREQQLVSGLKMSSKSYTPVTAFQISEKGYQVLRNVGKVDKEAVHECVYAPQTRDLLRVHWDGEEYELQSSQGYKRPSSVTDCEDVSYVSSAYVPQCLRTGGRPTMSNAHRAHECKVASNLRDELDEVITLNSVSIIVSEFIPFGVNQIVQLNNNLGSSERVQGGFFTAVLDNDAAGTKLEVKPGLTNISILDYSPTQHLNFEADIHFPEDDGIVQVETFGCSMNAHGTMFYGMQIEAILDRIKDNMSLDHLSRLLVDVHMDSSKIVDSVISQYQRDLQDLIYGGDAESRDKVNLILSNEITPHLTAEEYMDRGEYENELKQVIGETRSAYDISEHDTLIFGEHGLIVAGANARHHEPLLCAYLQFTAMDLFVRNYFARLFIIQARMAQCERNITNADQNPTMMQIINDQMSLLSRDTILMEEILEYLMESLSIVEIPPEPPEQSGRALFDRLKIQAVRDELNVRTVDLHKNMTGTRSQLGVLRQMASIVGESNLFKLKEAVDVNTKELIEMRDLDKKSVYSLEVLQFMLAGMLAFDVMDRVTGNDWSVVNMPWMTSLVESAMRSTPGVWMTINFVVWAGVVALCLAWRARSTYRGKGFITLRQRWMCPCNIRALNEYLRDQDLTLEDKLVDENNTTVVVRWVEPSAKMWGGSAPTIELEYDQRTSFLLHTVISYNRRTADKKLVFNAVELRMRLLQILQEKRVIEAQD